MERKKIVKKISKTEEKNQKRTSKNKHRQTKKWILSNSLCFFLHFFDNITLFKIFYIYIFRLQETMKKVLNSFGKGSGFGGGGRRGVFTRGTGGIFGLLTLGFLTYKSIFNG